MHYFKTDPIGYNCWHYVVVGPQNGWNDPPALNRAATKKKVGSLIGAASKSPGNALIINQSKQSVCHPSSAPPGP